MDPCEEFKSILRFHLQTRKGTRRKRGSLLRQILKWWMLNGKKRLPRLFLFVAENCFLFLLSTTNTKHWCLFLAMGYVYHHLEDSYLGHWRGISILLCVKECMILFYNYWICFLLLRPGNWCTSWTWAESDLSSPFAIQLMLRACVNKKK